MTEAVWNVQFVGVYFATTVHVFAEETADEQVVIDLAANVLKQHYGWDIIDVSTIDIDVTKT